jgi:hypothetical protein
METKITIERGVPIVETRGRPTSDEYLKLLVMEIGESFVSSKSRDTLYQIARNLHIPISIKSAGEQGWRVWKIGPRNLQKFPKTLRQALRKALRSGSKEE